MVCRGVRAERWAQMIEEVHLRDAAIISAAQRIEHYEIALHGTLASWASRAAPDDTNVLNDILAQEKEADAELTRFAVDWLNPSATDAA